jgi:regulator of protease activity HflC (stomatin/prohibitin superfamily)
MNPESIFSLMATAAWIAAFVIVIVVIIRAGRGKETKGATAYVLGALLIALVFTVISLSVVFIEPTERGVVISAMTDGVRSEALEPGLGFIVPFLEYVERYPISRQTYTMSIAVEEGAIQGDDSVEARTADGQIVKVDASVIFSIDPARTIEQHVKWNGAYVDNLVRPVARGVIRDAVSQFAVEEVVSSKRFELLELMAKGMGAALEEGGLIQNDFVLRNIAFSDEYAASVEQKQIAEQQAQQAAYVVQQREFEADQARKVAQGLADAKVIEAEGNAKSILIEAQAQAEALRLIAASLAENPDLLTYEYIQRLAPGIQAMLVPSDNPFLLPIPSLEGTTTTPVVP